MARGNMEIVNSPGQAPGQRLIEMSYGMKLEIPGLEMAAEKPWGFL